MVELTHKLSVKNPVKFMVEIKIRVLITEKVEVQVRILLMDK